MRLQLHLLVLVSSIIVSISYSNFFPVEYPTCQASFALWATETIWGKYYITTEKAGDVARDVGRVILPLVPAFLSPWLEPDYHSVANSVATPILTACMRTNLLNAIYVLLAKPRCLPNANPQTPIVANSEDLSPPDAEIYDPRKVIYSLILLIHLLWLDVFELLFNLEYEFNVVYLTDPQKCDFMGTEFKPLLEEQWSAISDMDLSSAAVLVELKAHFKTPTDHKLPKLSRAQGEMRKIEQWCRGDKREPLQSVVAWEKYEWVYGDV